jgi:hypothetical protein
MQQTWELWYPDAGAAGLSFARCRVDSHAVEGCVLVHAAPPRLEVVVTDEGGARVARGEGLERHAHGPMSLLVLDGQAVRLEDRWPDQQEDLGRLVILPGGEVGILREWWNAEDHTEWRWQVDFYNHV